jgi:hypothetical protein
MLPLLLNALTVVTARIAMPGTGVWVADLDVDLDITGIVPTGKAALTVGTTVLLGTIDPRASGKFGSKAHVQLVGGGGGWDKPVLPLHLHNDFGVLSTAVFSVTAAEVGEVVVDIIPKAFGVDYARTAGPASRVLAGVDWHVEPSGITVVGPRPPIPFNPLDVEILSWDPSGRTATLATSEIVLPGTILVDLRFGTATIKDVEQTFSADGARTTAWCETGDLPAIPGAPSKEVAGNRLARAIGALAKEASGATYLRRYLYRVVIQGADDRVTLQAVDLTTQAPIILQQIDVWPGVVGATAKFTPGTQVHVVFVDGDPSKPVVVGFDAAAPPPVEVSLQALKINLGLGTKPVATAPEIVTWAAAVIAACATAPGGAITIPPLAPTVASTKAFTE